MYSSKFYPQNYMNILSQPKWGNPLFKIQYVKQWYTRGIHFVRDIVRPDGSLKSMEDLTCDYGIHITFWTTTD
jgi:hypothetical protein